MKNLGWKIVTVAGRLTDGEIYFLEIQEGTRELLTEEVTAALIEGYADLGVVRRVAGLNGISPGLFFREQVLPDNPTIISGDFGEILARHLSLKIDEKLRIPHMRWREKETKNSPIQGIDILGYQLHDKKPSGGDLLFLFEVKTRTTKVDKEIVAVALQDAIKHLTTHLTNSLYFIQVKLTKNNQIDEANDFARFSDPISEPFKIVVVPLVVHEVSIWQDNFLEQLPPKGLAPDDTSIRVQIICVPNLREWIEEIYVKSEAGF